MPALPDDLVRIFEGGRLHTAGLLMDRSPVTEADVAALLGGPPAGPDGARRVALVTWVQAVACCNARSRLAGRPVAYDEATGGLLDAAGRPAEGIAAVAGFRLPTAAEWESAAKSKRPGEMEGNWWKVLDGLGRRIGQYYTAVLEVRLGWLELEVNDLGLRGMLGFVREWCGGEPSSGAVRNAFCFWEEYYTNYNNDLGFMVRQRAGTEADRNAFRMVVSGG
jgi:formylglycine-generating enzyme required for sulfatase activity